MKLAVLTDEADVYALIGEWQSLATTLPESTPYSRPTWVLPWWRHRQRTGTSWLCFAVYADDGALTGVLPLIRYSDGTIRYAGYDLHDIAEALTAADRAAELWLSVVGWIRDNAAPAVIDLPTLSTRDRACLGALAADVTDIDLDPGAVIELPSTWEEYQLGLSRRRRQNLAYYRRRLERDHGRVTFAVTVGDQHSLREHLWALWSMRERSWKDRGRYDELANHARGEPLRAFLTELAHDAAADVHPAQVASLYAGSRLIAAELLLRSGPRLWIPIRTFDPDFAMYRPGQHLAAECIRYAISLGCQRFELGRGIEPYKFELGARRYDLTNTIVTIVA